MPLARPTHLDLEHTLHRLRSKTERRGQLAGTLDHDVLAFRIGNGRMRLPLRRGNPRHQRQTLIGDVEDSRHRRLLGQEALLGGNRHGQQRCQHEERAEHAHAEPLAHAARLAHDAPGTGPLSARGTAGNQRRSLNPRVR